MTVALPPYVAGSQDRRVFVGIRGCTFHVIRSGDAREVGFTGQGRDGDYVPDDMLEPRVLAEVLDGIDGLYQLWTGYRAPSEDVLASIERRMLVLAGDYYNLQREVHGDRDAAFALLALPMHATFARQWYLSGGFAITLDVPPTGDAVVWSWAWGRPPGEFTEQTLAALGASTERVAGTDVNRHFVVPRELVGAFLGRALDHLGPNDVRVIDSPHRGVSG